jgi:hypothetical protein
MPRSGVTPVVVVNLKLTLRGRRLIISMRTCYKPRCRVRQQNPVAAVTRDKPDLSSRNRRVNDEPDLERADRDRFGTHAERAVRGDIRYVRRNRGNRLQRAAAAPYGAAKRGRHPEPQQAGAALVLGRQGPVTAGSAVALAFVLRVMRRPAAARAGESHAGKPRRA